MSWENRVHCKWCLLDVDWLHRLLCASSSNQTLETFSIRIQTKEEALVLPLILKPVFHAFLNNILPSVKALVILITSDKSGEVGGRINMSECPPSWVST